MKRKKYMPSGTNIYPVIGEGHVMTIDERGNVEQPSGIEESMSKVATMNEFIRYMVNTDGPVQVSGIDARNPPESPQEPRERSPEEDSEKPYVSVAGPGIRDENTLVAATGMYMTDVLRQLCRNSD